MARDSYCSTISLLNSTGFDYRIHDFGAGKVTDVQGDWPFPVESLLKTLAFQIRQEWVLVALRATDRLDYRRLADHFGVSRTAIASPSPEVVEAALGAEMGGVGPIPPDNEVKVLFDANVLDKDVVFCGVGRNGKTLEIGLQDLLQVTKGQVAAVVRQDD